MSVTNYIYKSYPYGMYRFRFKKQGAGIIYIAFISDSNTNSSYTGYCLSISGSGVLTLYRNRLTTSTVLATYIIPDFDNSREYHIIITRDIDTDYFSIYVNQQIVQLSNGEQYVENGTYEESYFYGGCYFTVSGSANDEYDYVTDVSITSKIVSDYIIK